MAYLASQVRKTRLFAMKAMDGQQPEPKFHSQRSHRGMERPTHFRSANSQIDPDQSASAPPLSLVERGSAVVFLISVTAMCE